MKTAIYTDAPEVRRIASLAFPAYTGRKFKVDTLTGPKRLDSCWSGGSRDYYVVIDLETGQSVPIPENGTPFSNGGQIFTVDNLPRPNIAIVQHTIFCGKDLGITIYVSPENLNRFALPERPALTLAQRIVLAFTIGRKSSYNGRNRAEMALYEAGLPLAEWDQAKAELIAMGLLKSNGAVTDSGRNANQDNAETIRVPGFNPYGIQTQ